MERATTNKYFSQTLLLFFKEILKKAIWSKLKIYLAVKIKPNHIVKYLLHYKARKYELHLSKASSRKSSPQPAFTCSKSTTETLKQGVKLFKVNNKDTRTTPMASFCYLYC